MRRASSPTDHEHRGLLAALQTGVPDGEKPAAPESDEDGARRKRWWGDGLTLRNWKVRNRLIALVIVPTLTGVVLGGIQIFSSVNSATEYGRAGEIASFAMSLGRLAHEVQLERDLSTRHVLEGRRGEISTLMRDQRAVVDKAVSAVWNEIDAAELITADGESTQGARAEIERIRTRLTELAAIRKAATDTALGAQPLVERYSGLISDLLALHDEIGRGITDDGTLSTGVSAFAALARAKEQASRERALLSIALQERKLSGTLMSSLVAAKSEAKRS